MVHRRLWSGVAVAAALSLVAAACAPAAPPAPTAAPPKPAPTVAPAPAAKPAPTVAPAPAAKPAEKPAEKPAAKPPEKPPAVVAKAPTRPVEFVITTTPGGGSDIYARFIIGIIEKLNLSPQPFLPTNKPGGAGAVAMKYLADKKGDPHAVMITLNSHLTTPMLQDLPYTYKSFTNVSLLALDSFFLWVPSDSPWKSWADFVKAAQEESVQVAGTGSKQEDEILFKLIEKTAKTKPFTYVPYASGGEVCTALVGKQALATVNNPSECLAHYPDRARPLAAFLDARSPAFKDLPTTKELGTPITYFNMRAIVGAPDMPKESQAWMVETMKKVYDSSDWQDFLKKNALDAKFVSGEEFDKFLADFEATHRTLMKEAGWIK